MEQSTLAIIIIILAVISFALEKIPLAMTAMIAALAMGLTGILPIKEVYSSFGASATVFVAAMMIVGNALFENGIADALGKSIFKIKLFQNERIFIVAVVTVGTILSAFSSNSAVLAMLIPLIGSVSGRSGGRITNKNVIMPAAVAAGAGGFCTLAGSTPQMIGQGFFIDSGIRPMEFFELGYAGFPLCFLMIIYFSTFGYKIIKKAFDFEDVLVIESSEESADKKEIPKYKFYLTSLIAIACVIGFMSGLWDITTVALLGATAMIVTKCIDLKKALKGVDWNTVIILAASQAFAKGLDTSGAGKLIAEGFIGILGDGMNPVMILGAFIFITVTLTNFMSNAAVTAMLLPIAVNIAYGINASAFTFGIAVILSSQFAFATPVAQPVMAQALVGGYRFKHYILVGLPITLIMTAVAIFLIPAIYGL